MASLKEAIKNTQNSLGKIVKKPPLRDKELTRPPFRFLHDVISAVIKVQADACTTGGSVRLATGLG